MPPFRPRRSLRPVRPRLTHRALLWYLAAAALTVGTAVAVDTTLRRAEAAEDALGRTRSVAVVARPVPAGAEVEEGDLRRESWPVALVPDGAVAAEPIGAVALVDLWPGEPVLVERVGGDGAGGVAALLEPGQRAVPVPIVVPGLPVEVGDRVDVLAGGAVGGPTGDLPVSSSPPDLLAADAAVVHVGEEAVVVAVDPAEAAEVAAALTAGPVVLALRPPGG